MVVATSKFAALATQSAREVGLGGARIAVVPHPVGGMPREALAERAEQAVDEIVALLSGRPGP